MSTKIIDITEEDTITCTVCNCIFDTNEITTDDFNFELSKRMHSAEESALLAVGRRR